MVDMTALAGAASSLKTAGEIVKAMINLRDAAAFQAKAVELLGEIVSAQSNALAAQSAQSALLQRVRELEEEVARVKAWETEKQRYKLERLPPGVFVYALKPAMADGEPVHQICQTCYERGKKSALHASEPRSGQHTLSCNECGAKLKVGNYRPDPSGYDPGSGGPDSWQAR